MTARQLESEIETRLQGGGYLVNPQVSIEVLNYRPFYIIGEVNSPGSYQYVSGMTVTNAVALAGGFSYRADQGQISISRGGSAGAELDRRGRNRGAAGRHHRGAGALLLGARPARPPRRMRSPLTSPARDSSLFAQVPSGRLSTKSPERLDAIDAHRMGVRQRAAGRLRGAAERAARGSADRPADVLSPLSEDRPYGPWGAHVIAADKLGRFNPYIYRDGGSDGHPDGYRCSADLRDPTRPTFGPQEQLFDDCQIAVVIDRLRQAFEGFPGQGDGAAPSELFAPGCAGRTFTLTLFIHGGLNDTVSSMRRARDHTRRILGDCIYPIYLNWEAGPFSSYWDHVVNIRGGERIDTFVPQPDALPPELKRNLPSETSPARRDAYELIKLFQRIFAPLYIATDLGEAVVRAPTSWISQGVQGAAETLTPIFPAIQNPGVTLEPCESLYDHRTDGNGSCHAGAAPSWPQIGPGNNVVIEGETDLALGLADWWPVALSPFRLVTTPLADSLGESIWNNLLRTVHATLVTEADYAFEQQWFLDGVPNNDPLARLDPVCARQQEGFTNRHRPIGVFSKFIFQLQRFLCDQDARGVPNRYRIKVNLVAHSMGAIIANELIGRYDLGYDNLVYGGAASSIRHFALTVVPYIQRRLHDPSAPGVALPTGHLVRFYNLMLHPRREAREARWYGAAPAGSLLVWVDSMYEHTDSTLRPHAWPVGQRQAREVAAARGRPAADVLQDPRAGRAGFRPAETAAVRAALAWRLQRSVLPREPRELCLLGRAVLGRPELFSKDARPPVPSRACVPRQG